MAYLGSSFLTYIDSDLTEQCLYHCEWKAARDAALARGDAILTMEIVERPPGCTCVHEETKPAPGGQTLPDKDVSLPNAQSGGLAVAVILGLLFLGA